MTDAITEPVEVAPAAADEAPAFVVPSVVVPHIPASAYAPADYQPQFLSAARDAGKDAGASLLSFVLTVAVVAALFILARRFARSRCRCPVGCHCEHCRR